MDSSRSQNPFYLVLLTVVLLGLLSFIKSGFTLAGFELRPVSLLADVLRKEPRRLTAGLPPPNGPAALPAPGAAPLPDQPAPAAATDTSAAGAVTNVAGLDAFLAALRETKAHGKKTRIAYFGDSMIEGDLVTGDLRNQLQLAFGGEGVGFVPIASVTADFRATIHETASDNWRKYDLVSPTLPDEYPLGISGHVFVPAIAREADTTAASWVQFVSRRQFPATRRFGQARLFYGPGPGHDQVACTLDGQRSTQALSGTDTVNELLLTPATPARRLRLVFECQAARPVYGVSFEDATGVTLDNFSFRGNSGMSLTRIPPSTLAAFGRAQHYDLVILHYGVNVANARVKSYGFYERGMTRVVARMQQAFPQASILIVGMSDKGYRHEGEYLTDPSVPLLLEAQQRLARRNHAAFWNLFEAMGGENSMVSWVEADPPLANKDYTHVNARGARQMANLLYTYLIGEYQHAGGVLPPPAPAPAPAPAPEGPTTSTQAAAAQ